MNGWLKNWQPRLASLFPVLTEVNQRSLVFEKLHTEPTVRSGARKIVPVQNTGPQFFLKFFIDRSWLGLLRGCGLRGIRELRYVHTGVDASALGGKWLAVSLPSRIVASHPGSGAHLG